jgi:outer membrane protein TolC
MVDWRRLDLQRLDALDERERAALQLRDTMHRALVEIEQLAAEQQRLQDEDAAQAQRLREASAGERLAEARYAAGAIGRLDWLQARNARLAAEQQGVQLQLRRLLNAVGLQRALVASGVDRQPA